MPRAFSERRQSSLLRLAYFAPAIIAFALAAFAPDPWSLAPILLANGLMILATSKVRGFARAHAETRVTAYCMLLALYTSMATLLVSYPLAALAIDGTLLAALALSGACVIALLALWRHWPAFGLIFVRKTRTAARSTTAALKHSLSLAWRITEENELFFSHGLPVALCVFLLGQGALALAGWYGPVPSLQRMLGMAAYALAVSPLAHWMIVARSANAMRLALDRARRERARSMMPSAESAPAPAVAAIAATEPDLQSMLLRCIRAGQTDLALAALERGADPNGLPAPDDRDQRSPLVLAAVSPDLRLLRCLIVKGAELNRNDGGLTALLAATRDSHEGRPDAVMTLLTNGADPRCTDASGNTPLHYAALAARPIVAALLCDADAPVDVANRDGLTPLGMACANANWELMRFLLERGARVETEHAQPALIAAASVADDDPHGVKFLLKRKAHVNARGRLGRTPLMTAALLGHTAIAKTLLEAGAQVDLADAHGTTALMEAARGGAVGVLEVIAAHSFNADLCDAHGRTALMIASQSKQACELAVQKLLEMGASPAIAAADGRRAVDYAAAAGRWNIVARLDPHYPVPATLAPNEAKTPALDSPEHLLDALRFAHWNIVETFAARVREWPQAERTSLFEALLAHDDPAPRRWLLNHGLDIELDIAQTGGLLQKALEQLPAALPAVQDLLDAAAQPAGGQALQRVCAALAASDQQRSALESTALMMLERGADMFAPDAAGRTPLAHAVACSSIALVNAMLARGADPNALDRHGRTPLFDALQLPSTQAQAMIVALLAAGANPEAIAANGETPLGLALARSDHELHRWLNWPSWKLPLRVLRAQDLIGAASAGDAAAVDKLLALGLPIDAVDAQGATALLRAAGCGHASLVASLIARGANPAHAAATGANALSAAVSARHVGVIDKLLSAGVAVDQRLPGGGTALMIAAALGYPEILGRLLAHGADANAEDARGQRALHAAAQFAFSCGDGERAMRTLQLLLEHGAAVDAADAAGQTALTQLLGGRADPGTPADQRRLLALLPLLLARHPDLNAQDKRGVSALHACAMHGLLLPARAMLAAGASPESRDVLDRTPRQIAHLLGFIDVAAELGDASDRVPGAAQTLRQPARGYDPA